MHTLVSYSGICLDVEGSYDDEADIFDIERITLNSTSPEGLIDLIPLLDDNVYKILQDRAAECVRESVPEGTDDDQ